MPVLAHMRKMMLPLAVVIAVVAIAVPTCTMVGCTMEMGAMPFMPSASPHFSAECPGQWQVFKTPASSLPSSSDSLITTLVAALIAAVVLVAPQVASRPVLVMASDPPPPPEEPRGERFRV